MPTTTKTVLITGASTGFGRATATFFAEQGWNVVATMRDPSAAGDLASRNNVLVTGLDVTDPESIARAIKAGSERFGRPSARCERSSKPRSGPSARTNTSRRTSTD